MFSPPQVALGCGTVGFDRDIFGGSPSLKHLVDTYQPKLSAEEQSFLDNEVVTLCKMLDDFQVTTEKDMPAEAWDYMRDKGFFAMKIPKEWGGKGFSTHMVSSVLAKLGSHCFDANATVAVPNSLGPGELLVRYGTPEQKGYFLPRLADGTLIPCFGLTGPHSGSDATSLIGSHGVVEERDGEIGVRTTFNKRYITLAPVAGVVGIGLDLKDPNGLLKGTGAEGFTVALLERNHPGLNMGPRHQPLNAAFMNGTVTGEDVWVPMSSILGGQQRCGFGWHMFVECLAEGRGVSLPAGAVGAARTVTAGVGAYARIRKQVGAARPASPPPRRRRRRCRCCRRSPPRRRRRTPAPPLAPCARPPPSPLRTPPSPPPPLPPPRSSACRSPSSAASRRRSPARGARRTSSSPAASS
jgi:acyl-CoA dehydrogenase